MDRQADALTIIASVRPETTADVLDGPRNLNVFFHVSRSIVEHGAILPEYSDAVEELKTVFIDRIAMRHVKDYGLRLARSGQTWGRPGPLPLTAAAAARMAGSVPPHTSSSRAPAVARPPAVTSPLDADDMFSPHAPRTTPLWQPPPGPRCDACYEEPGEPEEEEHVIHARSRVVQLARRSVITGFDVKPQFPVELALQVPDVDRHVDILSMLREAEGDAMVMLAILQSLNFCNRHAFKLVAAAADDLAHGHKLLV